MLKNFSHSFPKSGLMKSESDIAGIKSIFISDTNRFEVAGRWIHVMLDEDSHWIVFVMKTKFGIVSSRIESADVFSDDPKISGKFFPLSSDDSCGIVEPFATENILTEVSYWFYIILKHCVKLTSVSVSGSRTTDSKITWKWALCSLKVEIEWSQGVLCRRWNENRESTLQSSSDWI